jgi:outer membrane immunogenic protein
MRYLKPVIPTVVALIPTAVVVAVIFGVSAAQAADMAVKAPPVAPVALPPIFSWTGCYVGVEGGGNWGRSEQVARSGTFVGSTITGGFDLSGGIAGGTVGCNYQFSSFVIGIEDDYSWTDKRGSATDRLPFSTAAVSSTHEKWIDTLRGRAGFAWDRFFFYGTGGAAWAGTDVNVVSRAPAFNVTNSQTRTGWVAGVGGEWAAWTGPWGALTFKLEYLHADFGTKQYFNPQVTTPVGVIVATRDAKLTDDMVRAGMNFKFNWGGPVVAKY